MKIVHAPAKDKIADTDSEATRGYADFKRAKVERGLAQAADRDRMISAENVWKELGLES